MATSAAQPQHVHILKPEKELDLSYQIEECHHSQSPLECVKLYDQWSVSYDDVMKQVDYQGPKLLVQFCLKHLENLIRTKDRIDILEIGPGSGESGRLLRAAVIERFSPAAWAKIYLDGIDGSEGMLRVAGAIPDVYKDLWAEILQIDQPSANIKRDHYDLVMGVGVFSQGHMQSEHIDHFIKAAKPKGGLVVFGLRERWFIQLGMEQYLKKLEHDGVWKFLDKEVLPGYTVDGAGTYFAYERL